MGGRANSFRFAKSQLGFALKNNQATKHAGGGAACAGLGGSCSITAQRGVSDSSNRLISSELGFETHQQLDCSVSCVELLRHMITSPAADFFEYRNQPVLRENVVLWLDS